MEEPFYTWSPFQKEPLKEFVEEFGEREIAEIAIGDGRKDFRYGGYILCFPS